MYPHRIRLRGPWECELLADASLPALRRVHLPCRWSEHDLADRVRFRRRFGYPGRIDTNESVWLTLAAVVGEAGVWLNGQVLGRHVGGDPFEFEITPLLRARNELVIEVEVKTVPVELWGEVALEVRCTSG